MKKDKKEAEAFKYRLIGTLNLFGVIPEIVYPVFESDGKYFLQSRWDPFKIASFDFLTNKELIKDIRPLYQGTLMMPKEKFEYTEGDNVIMGYQRNEKELFIGDFNDFQKYINGIEIEDEFMSRELPYVIDSIKRLKLEKKNN